MRTFRIAAAFAVLLAFVSCTVKQDLTIKPGMDGEVFVDLELSQTFVKYIEDLSETTGKSAKSGIFDTEQIAAELRDYPSVHPVSVLSPEPSKLVLILRTEDYAKLLPEKYVPFIKVSDSGRERTISFHLGKDNYKALDEIFMISGNPILSGLAPQTDSPCTSGEYISMLDYVFEDCFDHGESASALLERSFVQLIIKTPGKVLSSSAGKINGSSLIIKLPLVDFLTLEKPVDFSFKYSI